MFKVIDNTGTRRVYLKSGSKNPFGKSNRVFSCSIRRMRLMRDHNLKKIFEIGKAFPLIFLYDSKYSVGGTMVSYAVMQFDHPHDIWMRTKGKDQDFFAGKVLRVSEEYCDRCQKRVKMQHLLVELKPNVLAFAEHLVDDGSVSYQVGDTVEFIFHRYNRKTKKIYGFA